MSDSDTAETLSKTQLDFISKWILNASGDWLEDEDEEELGRSDNLKDQGHIGPDLDLGPVPQKLKDKLDNKDSGMISARDWGMIEDGKRRAQLDFAKDYQTNIDDAKTKPTKFEKIEAVLPILDAPGNNPERKDIGAMLAELEEIDKRYGELTAAPLTPEAKTELQKEQAHERAAKLNEMERKLAEWLNRRTETGLPPSREAMAMSDLVQREHTKLIKEFVDKGWSPPPVADASDLTEDEAAALKKTWDDLVSGAGCIKMEVNPTSGTAYDQMLYNHLEGMHRAPTPQEKDDYRIELLSNMSRLCGSPAGRNLIASLEKTGKNLTFFPFGDPAAWADTSVTQAAQDADLDTPETHKAAGHSSIIAYPIGRKDSDEILRTEDGNFLFSPTHVIIGHEMVHALHSAQGIHRGKVGDDGTAANKWAQLGLDPAMWTDFEEVWTINKGDLSEQTLRNDYGLSADRFGHAFPETREALADNAVDQAEKAKKFHDLMHTADSSSDTPDPRTMIVETRKFGQAFFDRLTDAQKFDVYDAMTKDDTFTGPLPDGWDPLRLSPAKIKAIAADKLPCRMPMLGWTSYNLPYDSGGGTVFGFPERIKDIVTHRVHNPRTAQGRRFRELGEKASMDAFAAFKTATGTDLGRWNDRDWRVNLQTLNRAAATIDTMITTVPFLSVDDSTKPPKPDPKDPFQTKLTRIAARFASELAGNDPDKAGPCFADDALTHFGIAKPTAAEQLAELKKEEAKLKDSDKRLKDDGGLAIDGMSLVARAKAAQELAAFDADPLVGEAQTLSKALAKLVGKDDKKAEAGETYAALMGKIALLTTRLSSVSPAPVADAIRQIVIAPLDDDILSRDDLGDILDVATRADEAEGKTLATQSPGITQILANAHLCDALGDYIEEVHEAGKALWSFRSAVHMRETRRIADLAQGNDLVKAGLKQDTVVKLRRDATDPDGRAAATGELRTILTGCVGGFLDWYAKKHAVA